MTPTAPRLRPGTLWLGLGLSWRAAPVASALGLLLDAGTGTIAAALAWLTKQVLDELSQPAPRRQVALALGLAVASVGGVSVFLLQASHFLGTLVRIRLERRVERELFQRVLGFTGLAPFEDPAFYARLRAAELAAQEAPSQLGALLSTAVRTLLGVVSLLGVVGVVSWRLAVALAGVGLSGLAARTWRSRRDARSLGRIIQSNRWRDFYQALLIDVRAAKELRLFNLGELFLDRLLGALGRAGDQELSMERASMGLQVAFSVVSSGATAAGAWLVVDGVLTHRFHLGDLALFLAAVGGLQSLFGGLAVQVGMALRSLALFESYRDLMEDPGGQPRLPGTVLPLRTGIELRDVWFRYAPDAPWVLRGVDLYLPRGGSVGLVGVNGAGKSTLVKLLCGFYQPERGQVLWDGLDVKEMDPAALRARLAVTFQDFMTYDLSAAENIGVGQVSHLDDRVRIEAAARRSRIHDALAALPQGYDTQLSRTLDADEDEDGEDAEDEALPVACARSSLSGGQWQRVALARSLMRTDADLLILDEPSSGLDAEAEHQIHELLRAHSAGKTSLLISHRLSALRHADHIAVLVDGRVAELGNHRELLARSGAYARLFELQARGYQPAEAP